VIEGRQVLGAAAPPIVAPTAAATVDSEARATIGQMLATMRAHGLIKS
jgi:hypothetical protein